MTRTAGKRGLGRGLSALLGDLGEDVLPGAGKAPGNEGGRGDVAAAARTAAGDGGSAGGGVDAERTRAVSVAIDRLSPNPEQPRRRFPEAELEELAASIRRHGVLQPVLVRPHPELPESYQIIAGERRWRAAQRVPLHEIPVVVRELDDRAMLEIAIIENVQRADLDPVEEATGYRQLIDRFGYTQGALAEVVGKSRSHVANMLRLLGLPAPVLEMLRGGQLSAGHARALLAAPDPVALAREVVKGGLSVRQVEARVRRAGAQRRAARRGQAAEKDADTRLLEGDLSAAIGMAVSIRHGADGGGEVRIRYRSLEQLDRLCRKLAE